MSTHWQFTWQYYTLTIIPHSQKMSKSDECKNPCWNGPYSWCSSLLSRQQWGAIPNTQTRGMSISARNVPKTCVTLRLSHMRVYVVPQKWGPSVRLSIYAHYKTTDEMRIKAQIIDVLYCCKKAYEASDFSAAMIRFDPQRTQVLFYKPYTITWRPSERIITNDYSYIRFTTEFESEL